MKIFNDDDIKMFKSMMSGDMVTVEKVKSGEMRLGKIEVEYLKRRVELMYMALEFINDKDV